MLPSLNFSSRVPITAAVVPSALAVHHQSSLPDPSLDMALVGSAALIVALLIMVKAPALRQLLKLCLVCALMTAWTLYRAEQAMNSRILPSQEGIDFTVEGRVIGLPQTLEYGIRFDYQIERCLDNAARCPEGRTVRLSWQRLFGRPLSLDMASPDNPPELAADPKAPALSSGERWRLVIRLRQPHATVNPGLFDIELRLLQEGIAGLGYVRPSRGDPRLNRRLEPLSMSLGERVGSWRDRTRQALRTTMLHVDPIVPALVIALAIGDQAALSSDAWELFNRTGVAHLMSISGLHITMLAGLALVIARGVLRVPTPLIAALLLRVDAARLAWAFALFVAFTYSVFAGWGIPAQRTCWMLAACAWSLTAGRSQRMRDILLLASAVVTVMDPWAPLAAGFWLSFFAVASIVWHASSHRASLPAQPVAGASGLPVRWCRSLRTALSSAVASQWSVTIALLPISAWFFASTSIVGPLANAIAIPLVSLVVTPAAILMAVLAHLWPGANALLTAFVEPLIQGLMTCLRALAAPDWAAVMLGRPPLATLFLAAAATLIVIAPFPWPGRGAVLAALMALLVWPAARPAPGSVSVTVLDIGQGMAVLVETAEGRLLYDTGPGYGRDNDAGSRVLVPFLRARRIAELDAVVVSHADIDHAGGAASLLRSIRVSRLISSLDAGHPLLDGRVKHQPCKAGEIWTWSGVRFEFLHPGAVDETFPRKASSNSRSCVLHVQAPGGSILLAGDIEAKEERLLLKRLPEEKLRADILLAPHHGSKTSSTAPFIEAVSPRWVVAQVGYRNRFRHPAPAVVQRYRSQGATVLRTDHTGALQIQLQPGEPIGMRHQRGVDAPYWRLRPGE